MGWKVEQRDKSDWDKEADWELVDSFSNEPDASRKARKLYENGAYSVRVMGPDGKESNKWAGKEYASASYEVTATLKKCREEDSKPGRPWCIYKHDHPTNKQPKGWPKTYETQDDGKDALKNMHVFGEFCKAHNIEIRDGKVNLAQLEAALGELVVIAKEELELPAELKNFKGFGDNDYELELDRYRRHDHGGGDDGDDWLPDHEIDEDYDKGVKTYGHKLKQVNDILEKNGYEPNANFDLGEKGHFRLCFFLVKNKKKKAKAEVVEAAPLEQVLKSLDGLAKKNHGKMEGPAAGGHVFNFPNQDAAIDFMEDSKRLPDVEKVGMRASDGGPGMGSEYFVRVAVRNRANAATSKVDDALIESTIQGIKGSYGDKYSDSDYEQFRVRAKKATSKKALIQLVESLFDLDIMDARDMVS